MIKIVKQHKVTGEIVKVEAKKEWTDLTGTIPARIFAQIKAATEKATEWNVIGQEGKYETPAYKLTANDIAMMDYDRAHDAVVRAMNY